MKNNVKIKFIFLPFPKEGGRRPDGLKLKSTKKFNYYRKTMNITESGFLNISDITEKKIVIWKDTHVVIFDNNTEIETITLEENAKLDYFAYFSEENIYNKHFITAWEKSEANVNCFLLSRWEKKVTAKIFWEVANNNSKIDTDIVSLVQEGWIIDLDGIIQINEQVEKVEWYLDETNIFLWDSWSVRGFPTLLVRSNDVKAGHGCNIEKISDEKLFYLRSRGMQRDDALLMMVQSYIETIFGRLEKTQKEYHDQLVEQILEEIR